MFSTTHPSLPDMVAHASSAGAPFDSEVSTADLDSEAFATTPSATPPSTTLSTTEAMQLDMLNQLLDSHAASTSTTDQNNTAESSTLLNDHSVIAMASTTSPKSAHSPWLSSPSIAPSALKLEFSPLTCLAGSPAASSKTRSRPSRPSTSKATSPPSSGATNGRKRSSGSLDKDAKARERVLRNRAAAQESRDKKRKYVVEIETSNENLQQENCQLLKRLKTVESDNLALSQRLETLTVQFAQMQEQLAQSLKQNNNNIIINNNPGADFCQSAVLAKKDRRSRQRDNLTNSPQQKLAPLKGNLHTTISPHNNHRQVYSMTMKTSMSKAKGQNREARLSDPSAAQNRMETSCRSSCINRNRALTLSSSAAASFPITQQPQLLATTTTVFMMFYLSMVLPQLMLNFSTLFLISTGTRSNDLPTAAQPPLDLQEQRLQQATLSFIRRLSSSRLSNQEARNYDHRNRATAIPSTRFHSKLFKDNITSLDASVIKEIVTEFRQGRKDVARGLLMEALLSRRFTLGNDSIKGLLFLLLKK